jgi:uncharacterized membrane protein YbaN (DUF454 family)
MLMSVAGSKMENQFDVSHIAGHVLSALAIIGTWIGMLPAIASLAALFWYALQFYESKTVQRWLHTRRQRKIARYTKALQALQERHNIHEDVKSTPPQ